jgi:hypothetical protein
MNNSLEYAGGVILSDAKLERDEQGAEARELPTSYYLDEADPDILILRRLDDSFVAAFSAQGATRKGIVAAAKEDYEGLLARLAAGVKREGA